MSDSAMRCCGVSIVVVSALIVPVGASREASAAAANPSSQPAFRDSDRRVRRDDVLLRSLGLGAYESKRLKLYTDVPEAKARTMLPAVDAVYDALVEYFGPLLPDREGSEFQVTGYLMADKNRFRRAGLLPDDLPTFMHGRHRGQEFWANEQETDYYRRHLVIHEFTHCFMYAIPDFRAPGWYVEGMAELFGTHALDAQGRYRFRVIPDRVDRFEGLGRIALVRAEVAHGRWKSLDDMWRLPPVFQDNSDYAWSWAICAFLDGHPRFSKRFRELGRHLSGFQFGSTYRHLFGPDRPALRTEWSLFSHHLQPGFDLARAAIDFLPGKQILPGESLRGIEVAANRGWQSSGVSVQEGTAYEVSATGQVTVGTIPKPWISEPQGISIVYSEGRPIGTLIAAIRSEVPGDGTHESMLEEIMIGPRAAFTAKTSGTLYFRINDLWGSLADNEGRYRVDVRSMRAH